MNACNTKGLRVPLDAHLHCWDWKCPVSHWHCCWCQAFLVHSSYEPPLSGRSHRTQVGIPPWDCFARLSLQQYVLLQAERFHWSPGSSARPLADHLSPPHLWSWSSACSNRHGLRYMVCTVSAQGTWLLSYCSLTKLQLTGTTMQYASTYIWDLFANTLYYIQHTYLWYKYSFVIWVKRVSHGGFGPSLDTDTQFGRTRFLYHYNLG